MTRKHFEALAHELKIQKPETDLGRAQWEYDCRAVANACAASNGRFDRGRFLRACGVEDA